jgi:nucleoid-associated protein YgaU
MSIAVQQPRPYDLVTDRIQIAGVAGGAFEAQFDYRLRDGHAQANGSFAAGDGTGGHGQFQVTSDVSGVAFAVEQLTLEVFHVSPKDGTELAKVTVPVLLGRIIVPGYRNYLEHVVAPGESLWSISLKYYGNGDLYHRLVSANPQTITNPNVIHPGDLIRVPRA